MHDERNRSLSSSHATRDADRAYCVQNTLRAIERLAAAPHSAPELADSLAVSVRTARRLLHRLAADGYVIQDGGHRRRYRPTLHLVALASRILDGALLPRAGARRVAELSAMTGAPAHLWIWADDGVAVCIAHGAADRTSGTWAPVNEAPTEAAALVLSRARTCTRSSTFAAGDVPGAAAAVLDRGRVVAALGVTGDLQAEVLAPVALLAERLSADLAGRQGVIPSARG